MAHDDVPQEREHIPVVEDIPSHEIYASLLGINRKSMQPKASLERNDTEAAVVIERDDLEQVPKTAFGQTYAKSQQIQNSSLLLDPSNKGFKLLLKMGWREEDGGLGKHRQGTLLPIKTVLKKGKHGLGASNRKEERITHKSMNMEVVVHERKRTKAERKKSQRLEQAQSGQEMRRIRMMLRTDISDEHERLYEQLNSM